MSDQAATQGAYIWTCLPDDLLGGRHPPAHRERKARGAGSRYAVSNSYARCLRSAVFVKVRSQDKPVMWSACESCILHV